MDSNKEILSLLKQNQEVIERNNQVIGLLTKELAEQKEVNKTMIRAFDSTDLIDLKEVAKVLNYKGYGRNKIFGILRDYGIVSNIDENWNEPYQRFVNQGLFKMIEAEKEDRYGNIRVFTKTVVTQKGLDYIRKVLDEHTTE